MRWWSELEKEDTGTWDRAVEQLDAYDMDRV